MEKINPYESPKEISEAKSESTLDPAIRKIIAVHGMLLAVTVGFHIYKYVYDRSALNEAIPGLAMAYGVNAVFFLMRVHMALGQMQKKINSEVLGVLGEAKTELESIRTQAKAFGAETKADLKSLSAAVKGDIKSLSDAVKADIKNLGDAEEPEKE